MTSSIRVVLPPEVEEDSKMEHGLRAAVYTAVNSAAFQWGEPPISANDVSVDRVGTVDAPVQVYCVLPAGKHGGWLEAVKEAIRVALANKGLRVQDWDLHMTQSDMTGGGMEEE